MRLLKEHYQMINELDKEFGKLSNVPENNIKLKIIRMRLRRPKPVEEQEKFELDDYVKNKPFQKRYNLNLINGLAKKRREGVTFYACQNYFDVPESVLMKLCKDYGIQYRNKYELIIKKNGTEYRTEGYSLDAITHALHGFDEYSSITKLRISQKMHGELPKKFHKKMKDIVVKSKVENIIPDEEEIKKRAFDMKMKSLKIKSPENVIRFLNSINGRGTYNIEEANKWTSGQDVVRLSKD